MACKHHLHAGCALWVPAHLVPSPNQNTSRIQYYMPTAPAKTRLEFSITCQGPQPKHVTNSVLHAKGPAKTRLEFRAKHFIIRLRLFFFRPYNAVQRGVNWA